MEDFGKSIKAILYERMASPLFGSFVFSWCIVNWEIIYLLFALNSDLPIEDKLCYLTFELSDYNKTVIFPIISSLLIILVYPFLSISAYWVNLRFKNWQYKLKTEIENKQLLSFEQSIQLRMEIRMQEENFHKMLEGKDIEIESLKNELQLAIDGTFIKDDRPAIIEPQEDYENLIYESDYESFKKTPFIKDIDNVVSLIQKFTHRSLYANTISSDSMAYYTSNDLIEENGKNGYAFTKKGKYFLKKALNERYSG